MAEPAFDFSQCDLTSPDAIESFDFVSSCRLSDFVPPIYEPDDLPPYIPPEPGEGECPEIEIDAEATATATDGDEAGVTVTVTEQEPESELECAKSFRLAFAFTLPRGEPGEDGQDGRNGSDGRDGSDGITTIVTNCVPEESTFQLGPYLKTATLGGNGLDRIYLTTTSEYLTVGVSDCGVTSITPSAGPGGRQSVQLNLPGIANAIAEQIRRYVCEYGCSSSEKPSENGSEAGEGCADCAFTVNVGGAVYDVAPVADGLTWSTSDGDFYLMAPGQNVCGGTWTVSQYNGLELLREWQGVWDGTGCGTLSLTGNGSSPEGAEGSVEVCCTADGGAGYYTCFNVSGTIFPSNNGTSLTWYSSNVPGAVLTTDGNGNWRYHDPGMPTGCDLVATSFYGSGQVPMCYEPFFCGNPFGPQCPSFIKAEAC